MRIDISEVFVENKEGIEEVMAFVWEDIHDDYFEDLKNIIEAFKEGKQINYILFDDRTVEAKSWKK